MYDFHFGNYTEIQHDPEAFLVFVKRLMPRWINGIPDSECVAIFNSLKELNDTSGRSYLVETGCGASTVAMVLWSILNDGHVFSWDTNGSKGSFLRSVLTEAVCRPLNVNVYDYWTFIAFDSTNEHVGLPVLKELGFQASFGYFDSWHTLDHLMDEVRAFERVAANQFVLALDDAYYRKKTENFSYLNMLRRKLDLHPIQEPKQNICDPFFVEIEAYLEANYSIVKKIDDTYKDNYADDLFFDYFSGDRKSMNEFGMEEQENLKHRFDAWSVKR